jgi:FkbM family methyltransferase
VEQDSSTLLQSKVNIRKLGTTISDEVFGSGDKRNPPLVEVVVAHYDENMEWIKEFASPDVAFAVYSKGNLTGHDMQLLPNVGRESQTYLYHIVQNYDSLAPWTVFTQASRPEWGFQGKVRASGHLTDNVKFSDYLKAFPEGSDSFFIMSAAAHFPKGLQTSRLGIVVQDFRNNTKNSCPLNGGDDWTPWWYDGQHEHAKGRNPSLLEFYHKYIALDANDERPLTLAFAQGARFAVSNERIHIRSRQYYSDLLRQVERISNPVEGFWMEASWYDVFHPDALQTNTRLCTLPRVPNSYGISWTDMTKAVSMAIGQTSHSNMHGLGEDLGELIPNEFDEFLLTGDANAIQEDPCMLNEFGEPAEPCDIETNSTRTAQKWIPPKSTVLEIGARYGRVSCAIAEAQNQSGLVLSVEPDYVVLRALEGNVARHKCNVRVLYGVIGTTSVQVIHDGPGGYGTRTLPISDQIAQSSARAWTLDQVQEFYGMKFDTAVIDCEGCLPTLLAENPGLVLQVNLLIIESHNDEEDTAIQQLQTSGFQLVEELSRQRVLKRS